MNIPNFEYHDSMQVTEIREYHFYNGDTTYPVCPRCKRTLEREYQNYCDRCGQRLSWKNFDEAIIIVHP